MVVVAWRFVEQPYPANTNRIIAGIWNKQVIIFIVFCIYFYKDKPWSIVHCQVKNQKNLSHVDR